MNTEDKLIKLLNTATNDIYELLTSMEEPNCSICIHNQINDCPVKKTFKGQRVKETENDWTWCSSNAMWKNVNDIKQIINNKIMGGI